MEQFIFFFVFINVLYSLIYYRRLRQSTVLYFVQFIPLAIAAAQAGAQYARARKQKKEAQKALNYRNPALDTATNMARGESLTTRYAGQDQDEANVRQAAADSFANVKRASRSSADVLNTAGRLQNTQQRGFQAIGQQGQVFRQSAAEKYRQMLLRQAGLRDDNRQYSEALKGAAHQNEYNALNSLLGGVASTNFGGGGAGYNSTLTGNQGFGNNATMSTFGWNPNKFSSFRWNPNSFSAQGSVVR